MDEAWMWLIVILVGLAVAVFVVWIVLALFVRLVSFLIFYWIFGATLTFLVGLLVGFWLPLRVLRGRGTVAPRITTPDEVVAGAVVLRKARGAAKYYGWDHAWPVYVPYQAAQDARAVARETGQWLTRAWDRVRGGVTVPALDGKADTGREALGSAGKAVVSGFPGFVWALFVPIPFGGLWAGVWASVTAWLVLMTVMGFLVYLCQQTVLVLYRWSDVLARRRRRASLKCHLCYAETTTPSYRCKNADCSVIHRHLVPGPLGVLTRRCACGTQLPTTVRAAGKALTAVCPTCNDTMLKGSGTRMTVQLPVIGSVGAGKTRLLSAGLVGLKAALETVGGKVVPLNDSSDRFLATSQLVVRTHQPVNKTQVQHRPEGLPLLLNDGTGKAAELHLMDAAGESFVGWEQTDELRYLDSAGVLLLVLDPLAFTDVQSEVGRSADLEAVVLADGDQEEAYASVTDRLRAEKVRLDRRRLGVVLTKADILVRLPAGRALCGASGEAIEKWMVEHGQDLFVRRLRKDFKNVDFFLVDSMQAQGTKGPHDPARVFQWALKSSGSPVQVPESTGATSGATVTAEEISR